MPASTSFFLKKWAIPGLFFFIFIFSIQLIVNAWIKFRRWLDSNHGPLVSEATALPTEPQPLPNIFVFTFVTAITGEKDSSNDHFNTFLYCQKSKTTSQTWLLLVLSLYNDKYCPNFDYKWDMNRWRAPLQTRDRWVVVAELWRPHYVARVNITSQ